MQIEIKGHGIIALWRDLLDNADVTSTVVAGGVAVFLSYGLWSIGRGIFRLNRAVAPKVPRLPKPRGVASFETAKPIDVETAPVLARHWRQLDRFASGNIRLAEETYATHGRVTMLVDALDLEIANLLAELAPVSTYAAERTGRAMIPLAQFAPRVAPAPRRLAA